MIRATIFDLDGTLVQTERLKSLSYAQAALELCPHDIAAVDVIEAFKEVVGRSRQEVATHLVERFDLESIAGTRMAEFGVTTPWQAFVQVRLRYYNEMIDDPSVIRGNRWPHTIALLEAAREAECKTALATMSHCEQMRRVVDALDLTDAFDFTASRDDVENGKPDPEIYLLVADAIAVAPNECIVMEDSANGIRAGLAAGMHVVAVATPFTRESVREASLLPPERIVDDPNDLVGVVQGVIEAEGGH